MYILSDNHKWSSDVGSNIFSAKKLTLLVTFAFNIGLREDFWREIKEREKILARTKIEERSLRVACLRISRAHAFRAGNLQTTGSLTYHRVVRV